MDRATIVNQVAEIVRAYACIGPDGEVVRCAEAKGKPAYPTRDAAQAAATAMETAGEYPKVVYLCLSQGHFHHSTDHGHRVLTGPQRQLADLARVLLDLGNTTRAALQRDPRLTGPLPKRFLGWLEEARMIVCDRTRIEVRQRARDDLERVAATGQVPSHPMTGRTR